MKNNKSIGLLLSVLMSTALFSCGGNVQKSKDALELSFTSLEKSQSKTEWVESENNFHNTLERLESEDVSSAEFCEAVMSHNDSRLALLAGDLEESKLSTECIKDVNSKVKDYYAPFAEKSEIKPMRLNQKTVVVPVDQYKKINGYDNFIGHKEVVLTFDDGPVFKNTAYIVQLLKEWDIKSMFFFVGKRLGLEAELQQAKSIKALGHTIATHSHTHAGMKTTYKEKGLAGLKAEIIDSHNTTDRLLEGISPYFRFPGGTANAEIDAIVNGWGLSIWHWSIDSFDYKTTNPDDIVKRVIAELEKKQKGVLLFHDIHRQTSLAMPEILKYLADNNYTILLPVEK